MKKILIVDDNLTSLKQISSQLSSDYDISLSKSGALALKICEHEKPDLILLDIEMPDMDGFETIAKLKANHLLRPIPVIFLTGNQDTATEVKALQSGAVDFITKPVNKGILLHRIELHLQFSACQISMENAVEELENSIVVSFAELVECKDINAGGHVLRTANCVRMLGEELLSMGEFANELTPDYLGMIVSAAPFHDIGKIGISDVILLKPHSLSVEEYDEIKKHTVIGAHVLQLSYKRTPTLNYLKLAELIALGHHERYDGLGYPYGNKGDEIPLCCRIMAVANVYDACLTTKIYREALTHDEACQVILDGKGTEFDPRVVKAFEGAIDKFAEMERDIHAHPLLKIF